MDQEKTRDELQQQKEEPRISNKWYRGNYLIYDCAKGSFICVNSVSFEYCENQRKEDIDNRYPTLRCAPLKRFESQKKCFDVQYKSIHNQLPKAFCSHPKFL